MKSWWSTKSACKLHGWINNNSTILHLRILPYFSNFQRKFIGSQSTINQRYSLFFSLKLHRTLRTYLTSRTICRSHIFSKGMKILPQKVLHSLCINGHYGGIITIYRIEMGLWLCLVWLMRVVALIATFGMNCSLRDYYLGKIARFVIRLVMVFYALVIYERLFMSWISILLFRLIF